jgi:hypothetical protein
MAQVFRMYNLYWAESLDETHLEETRKLSHIQYIAQLRFKFETTEDAFEWLQTHFVYFLQTQGCPMIAEKIESFINQPSTSSYKVKVVDKDGRFVLMVSFNNEEEAEKDWIKKISSTRLYCGKK